MEEHQEKKVKRSLSPMKKSPRHKTGNVGDLLVTSEDWGKEEESEEIFFFGQK